jgi:hypothetical protein
MTSPVGAPVTSVERGHTGAAGRWLTVATSAWLVVQAGTFVWLMWWGSDLTIGQQPDTMPRSVFWVHVAIFNAVMRVFAVLLVLGPAAMAWFAAAKGLRGRAVLIGVLAAMLAPAGWLCWLWGSAA